jgi:hypothetical protein
LNYHKKLTRRDSNPGPLNGSTKRTAVLPRYFGLGDIKDYFALWVSIDIIPDIVSPYSMLLIRPGKISGPILIFTCLNTYGEPSKNFE